MCLAIPGKLIDIDESSYPKMGTVKFGGIRKQICLELVPEVKAGDYVLVHVGFAISTMDEDEANATFDLLREIEIAADEVESE